MDWQQIASLGIVFISGVILLRSEIRKRRRASLRACGHDCDCSSSVVERTKEDTLQTRNQDFVGNSLA
ncbi:MAG: hypothetical protein HW412_89 [Bacteroidetes bacterium]|nr:hypothetical protein [Bacteroidota bacterium]